MSKKTTPFIKDKIIVQGAREHNLKNVSLEIPRNKLSVFTGVSGSGKSSLVFNTVYAEGQRRYVESLSSYARQFLERINKPQVDHIYGISPAVAIEQKNGTKNPRSTVGTSTEIYDYLRLLFARIGKTYCFDCGKVVQKDSVRTVSEWLEDQPEDQRMYLGFPIHSHEGRTVEEELNLLKKKGFFRVIISKKFYDLNDDEYPIPKEKKQIFVVVDRFKIKKGNIREKFADSIETTFSEGDGKLAVINADTGIAKQFNKFYECCGIRYEEPEPRFFSFNNPFGACPVCQGFGRVMGFDMDLIIPNPNLSISEGAIAPWRTVKFNKHLVDLLRVAEAKKIPTNIPFRELSEDHVQAIRKGFSGFIGIDKFFSKLEEKTYKMYIRILLSKYRGYSKCSACKGSRLRRESLQVKIGDFSIYDIVQMSIKKASDYFEQLTLSEYEMAIAEKILDEIKKRLKYLNNVGLGYLTLDRLSRTLSGGETQRINLATSLGSGLRGTLYVLDEPSIGLHPRDNTKLINILKSLRDLGNTVLVVEHDTEMMEAADLIYDMGPKAGIQGGEIVEQGTYEQILKSEKSLTGKYLSGRLEIPSPEIRNTAESKAIQIRGARENNLKSVDVDFPLNKFVVVSGVSGSGKSTLVHDILYGGIAKEFGMNPPKVGRYDSITGLKHIDEIEIVDQSPIGRSPRSNPISYVKGFEIIRELFSKTPQARSHGYKPGYFSFNVPGGRCETCQGEGFVKIEMQFLADLYVECQDCKGTRFKKDVRDITYRGKNIVDVLNMTVDEAFEYFNNNPKLEKYLKVLSDVGLGYIKLGQPSNTLSGGEAQRIKLALHLNAQKANRHTLFIFDEPTTGLHFDDIQKLLNCFNMLLQNNNSVVIIEHNLDIIKNADFVIDLGPEAGDEGGYIVGTGTPEDIVKIEESHTGRYLKPYLNRRTANI
ncbi:MAG: excinuclease ABC subunit UvrA [Melioribacteraceae bacterium]|nr:excinuclease ABC subunit UvrA [Melioribacteraceae bacterium]MCF8264695.1 excinuclease ABC subunit UvrA [Melioribacteraceae bacterium]MCF8431117.1 excinuclease ABC subunit UvrA [Melioribacteraceae bacterium]